MTTIAPRKLTPMPGRLFVQLDPERTQTDSGIHLPDEQSVPATQGVVTASGVPSFTAGARVALQYAAGSLLNVSDEAQPDGLVDVALGDIIAWHRRSVDTKNTVDPDLPESSLAREWHPVAGHVLLRPYSPAAVRASGIITWKNENFPRIWGHLLRVPHGEQLTYPDLQPGRMVVYARFSDELLGNDRRTTGEADLPVVVVPIEEIKAVMWNPVPATCDYE